MDFGLQDDTAEPWSCIKCGIDDAEPNIICDCCNQLWHIACLGGGTQGAAVEAMNKPPIADQVVSHTCTLDDALTRLKEWGCWSCPDCYQKLAVILPDTLPQSMSSGNFLVKSIDVMMYLSPHLSWL